MNVYQLTRFMTSMGFARTQVLDQWVSFEGPDVHAGDNRGGQDRWVMVVARVFMPAGELEANLWKWDRARGWSRLHSDNVTVQGYFKTEEELRQLLQPIMVQRQLWAVRAMLMNDAAPVKRLPKLLYAAATRDANWNPGAFRAVADWFLDRGVDF